MTQIGPLVQKLAVLSIGLVSDDFVWSQLIGWMDGSPGGQGYRAPYGAKNGLTDACSTVDCRPLLSIVDNMPQILSQTCPRCCTRQAPDDAPDDAPVDAQDIPLSII